METVEGKRSLIVVHHQSSMLQEKSSVLPCSYLLIWKIPCGCGELEMANPGKDAVAPYKHIIKTTPTNKCTYIKIAPSSCTFKVQCIGKMAELYAKNCTTSLKTRKMPPSHLEALEQIGPVKQAEKWLHPNFA